MHGNDNGNYDNKGLFLSLSLSVAQEMLSASISQTRILQTCGVPHPNMVSGSNPLQGNDQIHTLTASLSNTCTHADTHNHSLSRPAVKLSTLLPFNLKFATS